VTLGALSGNDVAVTTGLSPGDRIVVDGILKVQPGAIVAAAPIVEAAGAAPAGAGGSL
jgi:membrane fusion protein (multidrug efflux system)